MLSAAQIVFIPCGNYVVVMPRRGTFSRYILCDGVVYTTIRSGAHLLLCYATAKPRRHLCRMTRSRGHATDVSPRSNYGVHEQEACPASRLSAK